MFITNFINYGVIFCLFKKFICFIGSNTTNSIMYLMKIVLYFTCIRLFFSTMTLACLFGSGYIITITNNIRNSNVLVHCKSKDDDIGDKQLSFNQRFNWKFCANHFQTTLYFCHFYWESKEQVFDVYNRTMMDVCDANLGDNNPCNWVFQQDGFYLYDFNKKSWGHQYDWKPRSVL